MAKRTTKPPWLRANKYRVAPRAERTWNGRTYPSKAEMIRAQELDLMLAIKVIRSYTEQPLVRLGVEEYAYRPDFKVVYPDGVAEYEDVKGAVTAVFMLHKKMWRTFGPGRLRIMRRVGRRWHIKTIPAGPKRDRVNEVNNGDYRR